MAEFGIPEIPQVFLENQDLFYSQFNDIDFYVEDIDQQNLYLRILRNFFPGIRISKILPLGGKSFVIEAAKNFIGNRKKVFIVDLDFDEILDIKEELENLFYLRAYSIENYLLEEAAIIEFIKEQDPKIKDSQISNIFNLNTFKSECLDLFVEIIKSYLVIQEHVFGLQNVSLGPSYFYNLSERYPRINTSTWSNHQQAIEQKLKELNPIYELSDKLLKYEMHFQNTETAINNIPGKYLLKFLKHRVELLFDIAKTSIESFTYRLSGHCVLNSLKFLQININTYINN